MLLRINTDELDINLVGEILRSISFEQKYDKEGSLLTSCYEHFDVQHTWKLMDLKQLTSVEKNIVCHILGLEEKELEKVFVYKHEHENILMSYNYESDGTLFYRLPDKKIIVNYDCKKNHTWEECDDFLHENINEINISEVEDLIKIIKHADITSNKVFEKIMRATSNIFKLDDLTLASKFKTSVPTFKKWKEGQNIPHMLIRKSVTNSIVDMCKESLKAK